MKKILVPTDFSDNAYNALYYATRLFKNEPCLFYILNTLDTDKSTLLGKQGEQLVNESKEKLIEVFHSITRDTEDYKHSFDIISTSQKLITTIESIVAEKQINLIVMGTKGATGAKGFFIGSNTSNIIQKIKCCPVLAVPETFNFESTEAFFSTKNMVV
ncbi:universal stress protein [Aquimarina sp. AD10]|uniref:UspA domain-containing protein n=1 Tax=Aquimarina aggregata TaxID=1642818 RepID=A0A162ZSS8_9FLAO|nr:MULTISPECIES: universal stress protein [Aquimarina]AXT62318.1 universal stress protein [Aquimarina sp. AD10]KZS40002.1 hypothetical protein AWE51_10200 [Aquimarina aggregata]RKM90486.1 universal stress protein [Aquimarina sp. AD10]